MNPQKAIKCELRQLGVINEILNFIVQPEHNDLTVTSITSL